MQEFAKRLLVCLFLVAGNGQPLAQAVLVALVLVASMVYWCLARGIERRVGFYMCLIGELGLLCYTIFLAIFSQLSGKISSETRTQMGVILLVIMIAFLSIILIWQLARAYVDLTIIWRKFKNTDFYLEYVETEEERIRRWEKEQELAKSDLSEKVPILEPNTRAQAI